MAEDDNTEKSEEPTPQRLSKAEEQGQFPQSKELNHFFMFVAALFIFTFIMPTAAKKIFDLLHGFLNNMHEFNLDSFGAFNLVINLFKKIGLYVAFIFIIFFAAPIISGYFQTGWKVTPSRLSFDITKLSLIKGYKKLFSWNNILEFFKAILKIVIVSGIVFYSMKPEFYKVDHYIKFPITGIIVEIYNEIVSLLFIMACIMLVISGLDLAYQKYMHIQKLRMSKQEVKDERKQAEGDPQVKQKLRRQMQELARRSLISVIPKATVVITNPTHYSVALEYDQDNMEAPKVVAKGIDYVALRIRQLARDKEVPIVQNPPLARALYNKVEIDEEISEEHYEAVARIIRYVLKMN